MAKKTLKLKKKKKVDTFTVVNTILLILTIFIMFYPFWYIVVGSLMTPAEASVNVFHFFTKNPTLDSYRAFFQEQKVGQHFLASTYASVVGMIVSLFFTALAAYALSRPELPGKGFVMRLVLGAMLFNGGLIPTYMVVRSLGLINKWEALYIPGLINLFYLIIMRTYFKGVSEDMLDAARIDGAGEWKIFFKLVVPTSMPVIACIALFYLVDRWNDLMSGIIYINDPNKQPLQAMLYRIINSGGNGSSPVSSSLSTKVNPETTGYAATVITTLPIMLVYPFLQKYFVHGIMIGSVKE